MIQLYIYIFFSFMIYPRILNVIPCAIQWDVNICKFLKYLFIRLHHVLVVVCGIFIIFITSCGSFAAGHGFSSCGVKAQ